jgi:hypothetical protein
MRLNEAERKEFLATREGLLKQLAEKALENEQHALNSRRLMMHIRSQNDKIENKLKLLQPSELVMAKNVAKRVLDLQQ